MKFETPGEDLSSEEKFKLAKEKHPDPRSFSDKIKHNIQEVEPIQNWLKDRAELMVERSGINDALEDFKDRDSIKIADIGGGSQHIENEIIKSNPDKNISTVGIDLSDYASDKISGSEAGKKINSIFGKGEQLSIKDKSVEVASSYFTFQELNDEEQEKVLDEMIRIIEDDGKIIIVDEPSRGESGESIVARAKNIFRNAKVSDYNLHNAQDWRNIFEEKGLKIVAKKEFREDGKEVDEENPAQFFSYVLEKTEKKM